MDIALLAVLGVACALIGWIVGAVRDRSRRSVIRLYEQAAIRLDEAHAWRDRDRFEERRERDRLIKQRQQARETLEEVAELLRLYLMSQQIIDAERATSAAERARSTLASDWGAFDPLDDQKRQSPEA